MTSLERRLLAGYFAAQLLTILVSANGPFVDEGIYASVGAALYRGDQTDVGWLGGSSFLFPLLSAATFQAGSLIGIRTLAALANTATLYFAGRFTENLFGPNTAIFGVLSLALNGTFYSLGHLAVYDAFALVGLAATATYATQRPWSLPRALLIGACAAFTVLSKFTAALPLSALLIVLCVSRARPRWAHLGVAALSCALLCAILFRSFSGNWFPWDAIGAFAEHDRFSSWETLREWMYHAGVPLLLAGTGAYLVPATSLPVSLALIAAGCAWPLLQVILGSRVSLHKHVTYGLVLFSPLMGLTLRRAWLNSKEQLAALTTFLALLAAGQSYVQDRLWCDIRPVAKYLRTQVKSSDSVGFQWGWALSLYLYADGPIESPDSVRDLTDLRKAPPNEACDLTWIVSYEGPGNMSDFFPRAARRCGFTSVRRFQTDLWALARFLPSYHQAELVVYRSPLHREGPNE